MHLIADPIRDIINRENLVAIVSFAFNLTNVVPTPFWLRYSTLGKRFMAPFLSLPPSNQCSLLIPPLYRARDVSAIAAASSVLNQLPTTTLLNTCLSAKLQSPSNRVDLDDKRMMRGAGSPRPNPAPILRPSENLDMIVEHTLQELGMHTLRVSVRLKYFSITSVC